MKIKFNLIRKIGIAFLIVLEIHFLFITLSGGYCMFLKRYDPPVTVLQGVRYFQGIKTVEQKKIKIIDFPKKYLKLLIEMEDYKFYKHHGIDSEYIKIAYEMNKNKNGVIYGGSTITQQLARSLLLIPDKSYIRKYLEIILAVELDFIVGKKRVLELYINYCEIGKGLYGLESAANFYYKKRTAELKKDEYIGILTVMPSPLKYTPFDYQSNNYLLARNQYLYDKYREMFGDDEEKRESFFKKIFKRKIN